MYCRYCGKEISDSDAFCPGCGKPTGVKPNQQADQGQQPGTEITSQQGPQQGPQQEYAPYESETEQAKPDGYAVASLVLGILGLIVLPLIGGILAIVFGNISMRNNGFTTMARVGKILGIIAIVVSIILIVLVILFFVVLGIGLMRF